MDCQEKLDSMQEQFLPDIDKMINAGQCSKQLLEGFLCDLVDFERRVREKVKQQIIVHICNIINVLL